MARRVRAIDPELGNLDQISRVELEPAMADLIRDDQTDRAQAVKDELASRVWANDNPYD
jgi:hypothetical protein